MGNSSEMALYAAVRLALEFLVTGTKLRYRFQLLH